eukprot:2191290-Rhodomonas_salina.1
MRNQIRATAISALLAPEITLRLTASGSGCPVLTQAAPQVEEHGQSHRPATDPQGSDSAYLAMRALRRNPHWRSVPGYASATLSPVLTVRMAIGSVGEHESSTHSASDTLSKHTLPVPEA